MIGDGGQRAILIKVSIFAVVMLLVAAGLVVIFGQFRFSSINTYHAIFENASRLKGGNDVRIAGIPVGSVKDIQLSPTTRWTSRSPSTSATRCTPRPRR